MAVISAQFLLTALVVVLIPGTGVIYTLAIGLGRGRRAAIAAAIGCTVGIVPHLAAATLGLAAVLHTSALAFQVIKFAGVAYLLWLAWQALRADGALAVTPDTGHAHLATTARRGALIAILNPKLSLFFMALLPPFLTGNPATATTEIMVLGAVFMVLTFAVFVVYGLCAAAARTRVIDNPAALRWMGRGVAAVFAALAARLAAERA